MTVSSWFHHELMARVIASAAWTLILQSPIVVLLKLVFSGYQGPWNVLTLLFTHGSVLNFFLIPISVSGLAFVNLKLYKVEPTVYLTRWAILKDFFNPLFVMILFIYGILGGVLMNSYFSVTLPFLGQLSVQCASRNEVCLNEIHLFGVLFGGWIGLLESWDYFFSERRLIKLPHIYQSIKVVVWSGVPSLLKTSLLASAKSYLAYIIIYLFFGGSIRNHVLKVTRLATDEPLDSILGLINVSLALRCIVIGSTCVFTFRLSNLLFQWFLLKPVSFSIVRFSGDTSPLLSEALTCNIPLMRLWACRDWNVLAEQSPQKRSIIFSVSQPGNHPHNWNTMFSAIMPQCMQCLSALRGDTKEAPVKSMPVSPKVTDTITSPTRMRSMALKSPTKSSQPAEERKPNFNDKMNKKIQEVVQQIKKKPFIQFLWGELPDAKRRQVFAKTETINLLIEGLSHFVAASYTEDSYGVVQKDLPAILSMILDFQGSIELRGSSGGVLQKRPETLTNPPQDVLLKQALKWTVKSSIYRLVVKFQRHITRIQLSTEHKHMLEQYLEFRVG